MPVRAELSTAGPVPPKKQEEEKRASQAESSLSAYYGRVRQVLKIENYSFEVTKEECFYSLQSVTKKPEIKEECDKESAYKPRRDEEDTQLLVRAIC